MWCWWLVLLLLVEDDGFDGNNCRNNCRNNCCGCTNTIIINRKKKCHKKNRNLCSDQD